MSVLRGDATGNSTTPTTFGLGGGQKPFSVAVADLDGDGHPDLATANSASHDVSVLAGPIPTARGITDACPDGQVPQHGFTDIDPDNAHEAAVACMRWGQLTEGTTTTTYHPAERVSRAQMATFLARLIEKSGGTLPAQPPITSPTTTATLTRSTSTG